MIVCNGCSFTDQSPYLDTKDSWCNILGAVNIGTAMGSNERIFRTTIEYLNNNTPKFLVIGLTGPERYEEFTPDGDYLKITPMNTLSDFYPETDRSSEHKAFYKYFENEYLNLLKILNQLLFLQNYCKNTNIQYYFYWAFDNPIKRLSSITQDFPGNNKIMHIKTVKDLYNQIQIDKITMSEYCSDYKTDKAGHPLVEGSKFWATHIKEKYDTLC